jgi:hypothetical protein
MGLTALNSYLGEPKQTLALFDRIKADKSQPSVIPQYLFDQAIDQKRLPRSPPGWHPGNTKTTAGLLADLCTSEEDRFLTQVRSDSASPRGDLRRGSASPTH